MSKKVVEKEFKDTVFKQGFSLEQNVFRILEKDGWRIHPNRNFFDSTNNVTREFDLLAYRSKTQAHTTVFTVLIIECKFNPHRIVFYTRQANKSDEALCLPQFYTGDFIQNIFSSEKAREFWLNIKRYKNLFLNTEQVFGYQMFEETPQKQAKNGGNDKKVTFKARQELTEKMVFGALNTTMQATLYEQKIRDKVKNAGNIIIFFPVVIFSDNLYKASLEDRKILKRQETFLYRSGMTFSDSASPDEFNIYISSVAYLSTLLKAFNYSHKNFSTFFFKNIKELKRK